MKKQIESVIWKTKWEKIHNLNTKDKKIILRK